MIKKGKGMIEGYPKAGRKAPPGVRQAITEYQRMPAAYRAKVPLLYYLLGDGTPPYKMSKPASAYVDVTHHEDQNCANCEYAYQKVINKKFICSQISGYIEPKGWCRLWVRGKKG